MAEHGANMGASASEDGEGDGLDLEQVREIVGFVVNSTRRRPLVALLTFGTVAALGLALANVMPRSYEAQIKILAQRSSALHILGGAIPQMDSVDNPTKDVAAMIMRRDNLVALVKDSDLVARVAQTRPPVLRLKDRITSAIFGPASIQDLEQGLVFTLESKLSVTTDDPTSTVIITVDWSNPQLAYDLVTLVQKNFLEARYDSDVAMVRDSIAVLEDHAKNESVRVDEELTDYQRIVDEWSAKRAEQEPAAARVVPVETSAGVVATTLARPDADLTKALEEKRLQIRAAEESHQRNLETIRQQLDQAQLTFTAMHPTVIALRQQLDAVSEPSPEYLQLKSEERALLAQIATPGAAPSAPPAPRYIPRTMEVSDAGVPARPTSLSALDRDGQVQLAQSKLETAIRGYEDALGRLDAAKVELDITRAAYKHQYTVVTPAELPRKPKKATAQLIGVASVIGGAVLGILFAALSDLMRGQILETWQVRRRLKLDILGELDGPA